MSKSFNKNIHHYTSSEVRKRTRNGNCRKKRKGWARLRVAHRDSKQGQKAEKNQWRKTKKDQDAGKVKSTKEGARPARGWVSDGRKCTQNSAHPGAQKQTHSRDIRRQSWERRESHSPNRKRWTVFNTVKKTTGTWNLF